MFMMMSTHLKELPKKKKKTMQKIEVTCEIYKSVTNYYS